MILCVRHLMATFCFILSFLPMKGWSINISLVQSQTENIPQPDFSFPYQTHDFGKISHDKKVHHTFVVTNTGTAPLVLVHIATGCGCTNTSYTKKPIPPGKKGKITVTFDPATQRGGVFRKSITVYTNSPKNYTRLFITGNIDSE